MDTYKTILSMMNAWLVEEVKRALENYPDFEIIGEANNADKAKDLIENTHPDIIFFRYSHA